MSKDLRCSNVTKSLGGRVVLDDLSFAVSAGEVVSLLGASGSGKTTLLRIVAGLLDPDRGELAIGDRAVWSASSSVPAERRGISMVFQDYALWPHMSVAKNLSFGLETQRVSASEIKARLDRALEVTRLGPFRDRYPNELSGGQQQRVAIARCLVLRPALMLLDEPLSNLDAALREDMRVEMMELVRREGSTVLYVTHDQTEAMAVSDRIAVMRNGVIAQLDTPQAIYDRPADPFVASFIGGFSLLRGHTGDGLFRLPEGAVEGIRADNVASGPGILVIRPEDARPTGVHQTHLRGRVLSRAFQGRCWRLVVALGSQNVRLDWPEPPPIGSELGFSLPPERCLILADANQEKKTPWRI